MQITLPVPSLFSPLFGTSVVCVCVCVCVCVKAFRSNNWMERTREREREKDTEGETEREREREGERERESSRPSQIKPFPVLWCEDTCNLPLRQAKRAAYLATREGV